MKNTIRILLSSMVMVSFAALLVSMVTLQEPKPWDVPAKYKTMKNPVASNEENNNMGSILYKKHCASCHGKLGLGDGVKSRQLATHPGDFSEADFINQTDGEHFYKTKFGRDEMPAYENKITDEEIWQIVNYMKTLKK